MAEITGSEFWVHIFFPHKAWPVCLFLEILIINPKKIGPGWIADQLKNVNSFFFFSRFWLIRNKLRTPEPKDWVKTNSAMELKVSSKTRLQRHLWSQTSNGAKQAGMQNPDNRPLWGREGDRSCVNFLQFELFTFFITTPFYLSQNWFSVSWKQRNP